MHTDDDPLIARLNAHSNIHIRLFNPFGNRVLTPITRPLEWLWDFSRANHRMHNKALIVDGEVVLLGGRNVGDEYFGLHPRRNFFDLDVMAVGPVATEVGEAFDLFYNAQWAVPVSRLIALMPLKIEVKQALRTLRQFWQQPQCRALLSRLPREVLHSAPLLAGEAQVLFDQPSKIHPLRRKRRAGSHTATELGRLARSTERDMLILSPYLVPANELIALMGVLSGKGVRIRVLTNSLAANDVVIAHTGYAAQRPALLSAGVALHELAADAALPGGKEPGSHSGLHAKVISYDSHKLYIGTFNLDPRSIFINTEMGLLINSPQLAGELDALAGRYLSGAQSWMPYFSGSALLWRRRVGESVETTSVEPQASLRRRLAARLLAWLPVRSQL